jgi:hypothetical protein
MFHVQCASFKAQLAVPANQGWRTRSTRRTQQPTHHSQAAKQPGQHSLQHTTAKAARAGLQFFFAATSVL